MSTRECLRACAHAEGLASSNDDDKRGRRVHACVCTQGRMRGRDHALAWVRDCVSSCACAFACVRVVCACVCRRQRQNANDRRGRLHEVHRRGGGGGGGAGGK